MRNMILNNVDFSADEMFWENVSWSENIDHKEKTKMPLFSGSC